ncbi:MAG: hypothetical protein ACFCVE_15185 [Phycisphaerae bacterium]
MHSFDLAGPTQPRPNGLFVLAVVVLAAGLASYLISYGLADTLIAAELLKPAVGSDPRPRWLVLTFASVMSAAGFMWLLGRVLAGRQVRKLDAICEEA